MSQGGYATVSCLSSSLLDTQGFYNRGREYGRFKHLTDKRGIFCLELFNGTKSFSTVNKRKTLWVFVPRKIKP